MARLAWLLATLTMVLLTGSVLTQAGRLGLVRPFHASPRRIELHGSARMDAFASEGAFRWRYCQPTHWRSLALQR